MEYLIICIVAIFSSGLTLFTGFGLGTILTPVFAIFFPVPLAVAATAVVHLTNNLFKILLVGRSANKSVIIRFAFPAVIAALFGASLLTYTASLPAVTSYSFAGRVYEITPVNLIIGMLIVLFSIFELVPKYENLTFDTKYMVFGGLLSGFFGGLSGNQGAFRSMFLLKAGLEKEEFIGTNVVSAVIVDIGRLAVYGAGFYAAGFSAVADTGGLILAAVVSAFLGAFLGKKILNKITLRAVNLIVGIMLILLGFALSLGII
ncbi:MAG: TSUP family transporter [Elusimicrobia bacterium]|nr:TSUP family transporter [Candidatus Liberimonas magnetica]